MNIPLIAKVKILMGPPYLTIMFTKDALLCWIYGDFELLTNFQHLVQFFVIILKACGCYLFVFHVL